MYVGVNVTVLQVDFLQNGCSALVEEILDEIRF